MQEKIKEKCNEIRDLLLQKNSSYGNAVFDKGVLFDVDPMYAIQARINDKLNRMKNKNSFLSDNDLMDVTGYFILLQVLKDRMDDNLSHTKEWDIPNNMTDGEKGA
jgi:heat shock protein HspQ